MKKLIAGLVIAGSLIMAAPAQADHTESREIKLVAGSSMDRFLVSWNVPFDNYDGVNANCHDSRPFMLELRVKDAYGNVVFVSAKCVVDHGENSLFHWSNRTNQGLGIYTVTAMITFRDHAQRVRVVSNKKIRSKVRVERYRFDSIVKRGRFTSDRSCDEQRYGNCLFSSNYDNSLFICGTSARVITRYVLTVPRGSVYKGWFASVEKYNGRNSDVTVSRNGRRVYIKIARNGNNTQSCGTTYKVGAYYRTSYYVNVWKKG